MLVSVSRNRAEHNDQGVPMVRSIYAALPAFLPRTLEHVPRHRFGLCQPSPAGSVL